MPRVNLARLKAGTKVRKASGSSQNQGNISNFFSPKQVGVSADDQSPTSRKRVLHESKSSPQSSKKVKLSTSKDLESPSVSSDNNISSTTLTKLQAFEKDSKYFAENNCSEDSMPTCTISTPPKAQCNEQHTESDDIIIDNEMDSPKLDISYFSRKKSALSSTPPTIIQTSPTGPLKADVNKKTKSVYTPLELQFMEIKAKCKNAVLFVECGYKYKFFGDDAEIAAKELNIMCSLDHNFIVASIPTHRLHVHVKRLVSKGYKVGVVKQMETAALKAAGSNKSNVFTRELSAIYTKSTLIGEDMKTSDNESGGESAEMADSSSVYLMCLCEVIETSSHEKNTVSLNSLKNDSITYGMVAVQPSTGDIIFDEFQDTPSCSELQTRIQHIRVAELLIPETLSPRTKSCIKTFTSQAARPEDSIRVEEISDEYFVYNVALKTITDFTDEVKKNLQISSNNNENMLLQKLVNLPRNALVCFAILVQYLKDFKLDRVLRLTSNFVRFSTERNYMKMNGCTLMNLEIFKNECGGEKGTLFWVLNHTNTNFGKRLLKKWISQPLLEPKEINSRLECVSELLSSGTLQPVQKLKNLLSHLPDLERSLCSIYSKKCSTNEFVIILKALIKLSDTLYSSRDVAAKELSSPMLVRAFTETPELLDEAKRFFQMIDENAARSGDKTKLFKDEKLFPEILKCNQKIQKIMEKLKLHRSNIRQVLLNPSIDYCTVAGNEFLIEVRNAKLKTVPSDWIKISSTKQVCRFRTPFIEEQYKLLCQQRELLSRVCNESWLEYLDMFNKNYTSFHKAVQLIATTDCLMSLATVAKQPGYSRPVVKNNIDPQLHISQGRHPILDALLSESDQYVPNDTKLKGDAARCMIITGPNMGGKSCYIKQVALISIMAQIGSYVPATDVELTPFDAIYTRMGVSDNIYKGRSTFMVELQEASQILDQATSRSLVILDELGRGTSTHDGIAVAYATLHHVISKIGSLTLFVTHYPNLAEIEKSFPLHVTNNHMAFMTAMECGTFGSHSDTEDISSDEKVEYDASAPPVTFLYRLVEGVAERSYGLNVAGLAGIPREILQVAVTKSRELETKIAHTRQIRHLFRKIWNSSSSSDIREWISSKN